MPKKYHIDTKVTPLELDYIYKFRIERGENCINCGKCTKVCIYEVHKRGRDGDTRKMAQPSTVTCRNCFRCIQECPRGALEKSLDTDFLNIGGSYWKPDMFITLWKQAEDGKVPVTGAGYRGPFTGPGFDGMWTDMSEIVRPTRDGIHGREYISTSVELGRKLNHLAFDERGALRSEIHDTIDIPLPIIFDFPYEKISANVRTGIVKAAAKLNTFTILSVKDITPDLKGEIKNIIPLMSHKDIDANKDLVKSVRIVALEYADGMAEDLPAIIEKIKKLGSILTMVRISATRSVENTVLKLAQKGAEIIHVVADYRGTEIGTVAGEKPPLLSRDVIRAVHLKLVDEKVRDEVTIVFSGGIAMAEHVPKAMICGTDLTAIDIPLLIALGTRLYEEPEKILVFAEGLESISVGTITQRMVNLMGAWHSQLLEVMGAMGIREARRLRGETGRAIFYDEIDAETFGKLFKKSETVSL
ncbi:MAG: glutamate synthase family protein [Deltaproteobacteria bacterium]|nr:glutamate synthase family protein [Deltaproteobacteria bacterium]